MRLLVYHIKGKILYIGQLSRSCRQVNRFAVLQKKTQIAVERRKPAMVVAKHSKFNSPEAISLQTKLQAMKFYSPVLQSLQRRETSSLSDERRKQVSK